MRLLWAVIQDLFDFIWQSFSTTAHETDYAKQALPEPLTKLALMPETQPGLLSPTSAPVLISREVSKQPETSFSPHLVYVQVESVPLYLEAALQVDGVISYAPYATALSVVGSHGHFWRVVHGEGTAWIEKNMVTDDRNVLYPIFTGGNSYLALDTETKKLRRLIKDEFFAVRVHSPLLGTEYIQYRLQLHGQGIDWVGVGRPRLAGVWHSLLRGRRDVVVKVSPKTGSIMECGEGDKAFLAYVESVSPDETISISSIGRYKPGQFVEEVLTKEQWQALRPLWLQIC